MARSADWGGRPAENEFEPMGGVRSLGSYQFPALIPRGLQGTGKPDCPCKGLIPKGSILVCLVCHKTGFDKQFLAERQRTQAADAAAFARAEAEREAERGRTLSDRKAKQAAKREAQQQARHARQTSAEVAA